ncbi:MAG TPA: ABC transporter permease [Gammaproteobacteria bacterium]|nr:ABC transporter permease [Gammaproteobacteria bacterium]
MNQSIVWQLVVKDLRLAWPLVAGSLVLGVLSFVVSPWSALTFFVGGSVLVIALILLNVMLVSQSLIAERKEKIRVFMLSMPVSTTQYSVAKLLSSLIAYLVPAVLLTLGGVILLLATPLPNGFVPLFVATSVHCLLYFCVFLAFALVTDSQGWITTVIVCGNVSVSFVIPGLINLSSIQGSLGAEVAVWSADVVAFIAIELVLAVAALAISFVVNSRKTEFV